MSVGGRAIPIDVDLAQLQSSETFAMKAKLATFLQYYDRCAKYPLRYNSSIFTQNLEIACEL